MAESLFFFLLFPNFVKSGKIVFIFCLRQKARMVFDYYSLKSYNNITEFIFNKVKIIFLFNREGFYEEKG